MEQLQEDLELGRAAGMADALTKLCAVGEGAPSSEEKVALLSTLPPRQRSRATRAVLGRLAETVAAAEELGRANRGLHDLVSRLTAQPWHVATFKRWVDTAGQRLAQVLSAGEERLVGVAPDVEMDALGAGEAVFLSAERNVLLAAGGATVGGGGQLGVVRDVRDGALVVRERDLDVALERAHWLEDVGIREGDRVIWCPRSGLVLDVMDAPRSTPGVRDLSNGEAPPPFAGYDGIRDGALGAFLCALEHPETARRYGIEPAQSTLLLHGPPGCGKTLLARHLAHEAGAQFFVIDAASIFSPWVGESESHLIDAFRVATEQAPAVLFIDELDAIGRARGASLQHYADRVVSVLLTQLDGASGRPGIAVVAACNRADLLDSALRSRFARQFRLPRPRLDALRAIASAHFDSDLPYAGEAAEAREATRQSCVEALVSGLTSTDSAARIATIRFRDGRTRVVEARDMVSGRAVQQLVRTAAEAGFRREVEAQGTGIGVADVELALEELVAEWRRTLSVRNVADFLNDLPDDVDVVAVEPVETRARPSRYLELGEVAQ